MSCVGILVISRSHQVFEFRICGTMYDIYAHTKYTIELAGVGLTHTCPLTNNHGGFSPVATIGLGINQASTVIRNT